MSKIVILTKFSFVLNKIFEIYKISVEFSIKDTVKEIYVVNEEESKINDIKQEFYNETNHVLIIF